MATENNGTREDLVGNGIATEYTYNFEIGFETELQVYLDGVPQTLSTDYTVTGVNNDNGGTVVFTTAPGDGVLIALVRNTEPVRDADYQQQGDFAATVVNRDFDRLWQKVQELIGKLDRTITLNPADPTASLELPLTAGRAGKVIAFAVDGSLEATNEAATWRSTWATPTVYNIRDLVIDGTAGANTSNIYICLENHTSGTWATDLSNGKWELVIDVTEVESAQAAAELAQSLAEAAQLAAETAETNAETAEAAAKAAQLAAEAAQLAAETAQLAAELAQDNAQDSETTAGNHKTTASRWATETGSTVVDADTLVDSGEYSAKEYAIGTTVPSGSSKEWATEAEDILVDGTDYSAKHYATKAGEYAAGVNLPAATTYGQTLQVNESETGYEAVGPLFGFKNRIINGDFRVWQQGTGFVSPASNSIIADRFRWLKAGTGIVDAELATGSQANKHSLKITVTTADAAMAAEDIYRVRYNGIEGYDFYDAGFGTADAKSIAIRFRVKSSVTGTYGFLVFNDDASRRYIATYTIDVADTWEDKEIIVTGDTTGTWQYDAECGVRFDFILACGSDSYATAGSWFDGTVTLGLTTSDQVNFMATAGNIFQIEDFQVEVGDVVTPFERRPMAMELALCQRYLQYFVEVLVCGYQTAGQPFYTEFPLPVTMRAVPSVTINEGTPLNSSGMSLNRPDADHLRFVVNVTGTGMGYGRGTVIVNADF